MQLVLHILCSGTSTWKQQLTEVNDEVIVEARQWLLDTIPTLAQDTVSSLIGALTDEQVNIIDNKYNESSSYKCHLAGGSLFDS